VHLLPSTIKLANYVGWSQSRAPWLEKLSILLYRLLFTVVLTTATLRWLEWVKFTFRNFSLCRTWLLVWCLSGVRWSEHVTPVLEGLHWLPVSQRVVFKTALMVWKCVHGVAPAYLGDLCVPATAISGRHWSAYAICSDWHSAGYTRPDCNWTTKFRSQRTSHIVPSATSSYGHRTCRKAMKTHLFSTANRHWDVFMILAPDINVQT